MRRMKLATVPRLTAAKEGHLPGAENFIAFGGRQYFGNLIQQKLR